VRELAAAYSRHQGSQHAAAIAYRVMFSLVPFIALVVSVVDAVLPASRREEFVAWVFSSAPGRELEASVDRALVQSGASAPLVALVSVVVLLWSATGMMASIRRAFVIIWATEGQPYVRAKLRDLALVGCAGALLVVAFGLTVVAQLVVQTGTDVAAALGWEDASGVLVALANVVTSWLAAALAVFVVYLIVPPLRVDVIAALLSAAAVGIAIQIAVAGFSVYAARIADFNTAYGPLGTVFAFLVLVYVLALLVLIGAEIVAARSPTTRED
jgi:membrane protein